MTSFLNSPIAMQYDDRHVHVLEVDLRLKCYCNALQGYKHLPPLCEQIKSVKYHLSRMNKWCWTMVAHRLHSADDKSNKLIEQMDKVVDRLNRKCDNKSERNQIAYHKRNE